MKKKKNENGFTLVTKSRKRGKKKKKSHLVVLSLKESGNITLKPFTLEHNKLERIFCNYTFLV